MCILESPLNKAVLRVFTLIKILKIEINFNIKLITRNSLHRLNDEVLKSEFASMVFCLLFNKLGKKRRLIFRDADRFLRCAVIVHETNVSLNNWLFGELISVDIDQIWGVYFCKKNLKLLQCWGEDRRSFAECPTSRIWTWVKRVKAHDEHEFQEFCKICRLLNCAQRCLFLWVVDSISLKVSKVLFQVKFDYFLFLSILR